MRRRDREIKDREAILHIMEKCDVCRIALNDDGYPYILPLNFGMQQEQGQIVLYFHGAAEGKKYELIQQDPRVSFEMDCAHELILDHDKGNCTMAYESVIGRGRIEIVPDEQKYEGLCVLMKHYHSEDFPFNKDVIPQTTVLKLRVEQITGKRRKKKNH